MAGQSAMKELAAYLSASRWKATRISGRTAFQARGEDELSPLTYYFQIVRQRQFLFYIQPELSLLDEQLAPVAEFIARANFGMRIGNFELDYALRRPCFRSGVNFAGVGLSSALIRGAVEPARRAWAEFAPAMARVIAGLDSPKAAIRAVEYGT